MLCEIQAFCQPTEGTATNLLAFSPDDGAAVDEEFAEASTFPSELFPPPSAALPSRVDEDSVVSELVAADPVLLLVESDGSSPLLEVVNDVESPPSETDDELVLANSRCWAEPPPPPLLGGWSSTQGGQEENVIGDAKENRVEEVVLSQIPSPSGVA